MSAALLAINWEPELRGVLTVILGTVAFMGSVYLILGTNIGARLGFLVVLCGLAGWMALMGGIWWIYGIGLKGADPAWVQADGLRVRVGVPHHEPRATHPRRREPGVRPRDRRCDQRAP